MLPTLNAEKSIKELIQLVVILFTKKNHTVYTEHLIYRL